MTKTQEYLRIKRIRELGLPKLYVVKSSPEGVEKITERQVVDIIENVAFRGKERLPIDRYKLDDCGFPYEVDIIRDEISTKDDGYGSGFGDLWSWSYFSSLSKDDIERYYQEETERIENKYFNKGK